MATPNDAQSSRRDEEARLLAVLDTAVDGIIVIDAFGTVETYNKACERLFGYRASEVVGRNVKMLMPPPYHDEHDTYLKNYRETGVRRIIGIGREASGRRKDGTIIPIELSVGEALWDGKRTFIGVIRDLTERHRAQRQLQDMQAEMLHVSRLSALGEMASELAHEINQPLTAIMNYVQAARRMLKARNDPALDRIADIADKAVAQVDRAGQIIRGLRQFVKKGESERKTEDLNRVVEEACGLALVGAGEKGIAVRFALESAMPAVLIDRIQVQQVILNLVRNAVDALEEAPRRELSVRTEMLEADIVRVVVADSGPGIAPEVADQLFKPFVTTKKDGMGIGLSISRSIVEAHGGRLSHGQTPGGGATFRFTLPAASAADRGR